MTQETRDLLSARKLALQERQYTLQAAFAAATAKLQAQEAPAVSLVRQGSGLLPGRVR